MTLMDCGHPADLAPGVGFEASKLPPIRETIGDPSVSRSIPPYIDPPFSSRVFCAKLYAMLRPNKKILFFDAL